MLRLRHICAQTRGGGEGDCPGGPSQTPRVRNDGPEAQLCFRVHVHVRELWRDRPDLLTCIMLTNCERGYGREMVATEMIM
jgi:hypothetical protein